MQGSVGRSLHVPCAVAGALAVLALARPAAAGGPAAEAKKVVAAQAKAIAAGGEGPDLEALVGTFTADALVLTKNTAREGSEEIRDALLELVSQGDDIVTGCKAKNVKTGAIGDDAAWATADLTVRSMGINPDGSGETIDFLPFTIRVTELIVRDADHWHARVAQFSSAKSDAEVIAAAADGGSALSAIPGATEAPDEPDTAALVTSTAALAELVFDKAASVIGTSAKERAFGAKAKKLLLQWKSLTFSVVGGVRVTEGEGWGFVAANVQTTLGKKHQVVQLRLLVLLRAAMDAWEVVSVHYGAP